MNALVPVHPSNAEVYRASTDAAGLCREIVLKTAQKIQGRQYVKVEGWQAIAIAHGCVASADDVQRVNDEGMGGFKAMGIVRRMSDGAEIARAEGFIGDDESVWAKRPVYARRAMVQTRAISRACRSAFAHVVVLIDANLSTTPAEEMSLDGDDGEARGEPRNVTPEARTETRVRQSLAVTAALSAIIACETRADMEKWLDANEKAVAEMSKPDQAAIQKGYNARWDALDPKAPNSLGVMAEEMPEFA